MLNGKTVIVTGAGSGLGETYARALADCGADVVATDVNADAVEGVVSSIVAGGGSAASHVGSVTVAADAEAALATCIERFGKVDVLVNNAGIYHVTPIWEETAEAVRAVIEVNIIGTYNMSRCVIPLMKERRSGSIINVVSGSQTGMWGSSAYGATKAAIATYTYTWALELAPFGVRVNAISPRGRTGSSVTPNSPDASVNVPMTVFLASDVSATVTGQILRTDGDTISLYSHPRPCNPVVLPTGWTVELFQERFPTTIGKRLEPVGLAQTRYQYYEGLEAAPLPPDPRKPTEAGS